MPGGDSECPEARASPGRLSPSSRDRPALHPGPKGGAEGAPDVPDKRGGSGRGGLPPLAFSRRTPPRIPLPGRPPAPGPPASHVDFPPTPVTLGHRPARAAGRASLGRGCSMSRIPSRLPFAALLALLPLVAAAPAQAVALPAPLGQGRAPA